MSTGASGSHESSSSPSRLPSHTLFTQTFPCHTSLLVVSFPPLLRRAGSTIRREKGYGLSPPKSKPRPPNTRPQQRVPAQTTRQPIPQSPSSLLRSVPVPPSTDTSPRPPTLPPLLKPKPKKGRPGATLFAKKRQEVILAITIPITKNRVDMGKDNGRTLIQVTWKKSPWIRKIRCTMTLRAIRKRTFSVRPKRRALELFKRTTPAVSIHRHRKLCTVRCSPNPNSNTKSWWHCKNTLIRTIPRNSSEPFLNSNAKNMPRRSLKRLYHSPWTRVHANAKVSHDCWRSCIRPPSPMPTWNKALPHCWIHSMTFKRTFPKLTYVGLCVFGLGASILPSGSLPKVVSSHLFSIDVFVCVCVL